MNILKEEKEKPQKIGAYTFRALELSSPAELRCKVTIFLCTLVNKLALYMYPLFKATIVGFGG